VRSCTFAVGVDDGVVDVDARRRAAVDDDRFEAPGGVEHDGLGHSGGDGGLLGITEERPQPLEVSLGLAELEVLGGELGDLAVQLQVLVDRVPHVEVAVVHVGGGAAHPVHGLRHGREEGHDRALEHRARFSDIARPAAEAHQDEQQAQDDDEKESRSARNYVGGYCHDFELRTQQICCQKPVLRTEG
jgi:hypothetical protein